MNNNKTIIVDKIIENQNSFGRKIRLPQPTDKIGFAISTKDRVDFTLQFLPTVDSEKGFDIVWVDGSKTEKGRALPKNYKFKNVKLAEYHLDVFGGPDAAIKYGLRRLLDLGYDYCGLMENDILLDHGWFTKLIKIFELARADGIAVGAASIRNYASRVLEYRNDYSINWNIGAGMILFPRCAAQLILDEYNNYPAVGKTVSRFFGSMFGLDIRSSSELKHRKIDNLLSLDYSYDMILYEHGLCSVCSIPSFAKDLGVDLEKFKLISVSADKSGFGIIYPKISKASLFLVALQEAAWLLLWRLYGPFRKVSRRLKNKAKNLKRQ